jgi:cytochrome c oxidase subunit 2
VVPYWLNKILSALNGGIVSVLVAVLGMSSAQAAESGDVHLVANIFKPLSRPAQMLLEPTQLVLLVTLGIFLIVVGVLVFVLIQFRPRGPEDHLSEPPQIYSSNNIEMAWTVIPCLIVFVLVLVCARSSVEIQDAPMPENAIHIRLVGHQWWWEIQYPELGIIIANEIHVPVSSKDGKPRPTHIIHSFWVSQLACKTDLVPNRANHTWIEPFKTSVFLGNCGEYCCTQHAIDVQEKQDFYDISRVSCHKIDTTPVAGAAANTPENLHACLDEPDSLKPGCYMPVLRG